MFMKKNRVQLHLFLLLFISCAFLVVPTDAQAAKYYIDCNAASGGDGTLLSPFKTVNDANQKSFQTGDDLFLKCGCAWKGQVLNVRWSGSSGDRAVVGAYYGNGVVGVSGNRPTLDGELDPVAWTSTAPAAIAGQGNGLVVVTGRTYVTVENLAVTRSGSRGISVSDSDHVTVQRCYVDKCYLGGLAAVNSDDISFVYNTMDLTPVQRLQDSSKYGASVTFASSAHSRNYRNYAAFNKVLRSHGEGIDPIKGQSDSVIEYNIVANARSATIYPSDGAQNVTVRYNLVYCPKTPADGPWWPSANYGCGSLGIADECPTARNGNSSDVTIHGNLVFGLGNVSLDSGQNLAIRKPGTLGGCTVAEDRCIYSGLRVTNNTFVNGVMENILITDSCTFTGTPSVIKNNIFWCTGEQGCSQGNSRIYSSSPNLQWDKNLFFGGVVDPDSSNGALLGKAPALSKASGWSKDLIGLGDLRGSEFAIRSGSPAVNSGANLGSELSSLLEVSTANFESACGVDGIGLEAFSLKNQNTQGSGWELGADIFIESSEPLTPDAPTELRLR